MPIFNHITTIFVTQYIIGIFFTAVLMFHILHTKQCNNWLYINYQLDALIIIYS